MLERLRLLEEIFAIDIVAFAIMSNHCHLGLDVNEADFRLRENGEVIQRWLRL